MPDVLCLHHSGVRCGMPPGCVLGVSPLDSLEVNSCLWNTQSGEPTQPRSGQDRAISIMTAGGPCVIAGFGLEILALPKAKIWPIPPVVRGVLPGPHVVGLGEVDEGLIWLVDPKRYLPPESSIDPGVVRQYSVVL